MMRCLVFLFLLSLAACGSKEPLAVSKGPIFPLNTGHWKPTQADLATPRGAQ
jgi:predicted small lipoprotein YifL